MLIKIESEKKCNRCGKKVAYPYLHACNPQPKEFA